MNRTEILAKLSREIVDIISRYEDIVIRANADTSAKGSDGELKAMYEKEYAKYAIIVYRAGLKHLHVLMIKNNDL